jgi:hypothetical protein
MQNSSFFDKVLMPKQLLGSQHPNHRCHSKKHMLNIKYNSKWILEQKQTPVGICLVAGSGFDTPSGHIPLTSGLPSSWRYWTGVSPNPDFADFNTKLVFSTYFRTCDSIEPEEL